MSLDLSWDLFIVVFFAIVVAYSFIIGRDYTLKIIIGTYVAILAADGFSNLLVKYILSGKENTGLLDVQFSDDFMVIVKILIFVITIVLIAVKSSFHIDLPPERNRAMALFTTATYGLLSAGLLISTILVYASGTSLIEGNPENIPGALGEMYQTSTMVKIMINGYSWWFALPAVAFVTSSLFSPKEDLA